MAKSEKRPLAMLNWRALQRIGDFIVKVRAIVADIAANAGIFVTPAPPLATVTTNITALEAAETLAQSRVVGAAAARDEKYNVVVDNVRGLQGYVQNLADNAPNPGAAITIIQSSGFGLKVNGVRVKPPLEARNTKISGTVKLIAKAAGKRVSYQWQMSEDGGVTWTDLEVTLAANTSVSGLRVSAIVQFRVQSVTKAGPSGWTTPVNLVVT